MKPKDARKLSSKSQEDLRLRTVKAVLSGKRQREVAKLFSISEKSVSIWVNKYKTHGLKSLKAKKQGRPRGQTNLQPWQSALIVRLIEDRHPDQQKLPFYLWTREAVVELIKKKFKIHLSVWTVGRYLKRWGFTPQKPVRRAYERNPKKVKHWLEHEYPSIKRRAKREKALIFWEDEMGLRSDHAVGRSFARRGQTPVIPGTGQRFGLNMISAITNQGRLNFMVFKKKFTSDVFIEFLKRLIRNSDQKVFVIVDGHPVHRSKKVQKWITDHNKKIQLFFLPGYAPDLNPDEMLNQDVKSNAAGKQRPKAKTEMLKNVRNYLRRRQKQPDIVKNYFKEKSVRYAA